VASPTRIPSARRWALGELAANSAWAGTLVYSGVLFTETYGTSSAATGVALAIVAVAYLAGNQWAGRTSPELARQWMLRGSLAASIAVALTWAYTRSLSVTLVLFALTAVVTSVRMVSGTVYGFTAKRPESFVPADASRRALEANIARRIAEDSARGDWNADLAAYKLIEETQQTRISGRVDHGFVYERVSGNVAASRFRLRLVVTGDTLTELVHFVQIPLIQKHDPRTLAHDNVTNYF